MLPSLASDTIVAAATPPGRGGVAIVKVSGPEVPKIIQHIAATQTIKPRYAHYIQLCDQDGMIDDGLLIHFIAPHSYTGEDLFEFHSHGNPVIVQQIIKYFVQLGARLARPGEFTQRAYLNQKIDLLQAQAVADTIHAQSARAARAALANLKGTFSRQIQQIEQAILHSRMAIESNIDFSDQAIDSDILPAQKKQFSNLIHQLSIVLDRAKIGKQIHQGLRLVLIGPPNVGKSSLFNALCQDDAAIVTATAGTTRDLLERAIMIEDMPCQLLDTAGLRGNADDIEKQGIAKAIQAVESADLILLMADASQHTFKDIQIFWQQHLATPMPMDRICMIWNKADLTSNIPISEQSGTHISLLNDAFPQILVEAIYNKIGLSPDQAMQMIPAHQHHLDALNRALASLKSARTHLLECTLDLAAEHLKEAHHALTEMMGDSHHEAILDEIFSKFCIGK